jgi:lipoprotein-releasing system permease protein
VNFLFAWRYFKAKKSTNAINIIAWTSIGAIIVGSAALILVLSVFNGFEDLVKSLYSSFYTDLKVLPASGKTITASSSQLQQLKKIDAIRIYSLVVEEKAMIHNQDGEYQSAVYVKGVDENYRYTTGVASHLLNGNYDLGNEDVPKIILGAGVEQALGIVSDRNLSRLMIYLPKNNPAGEMALLENISSHPIYSAAAFIIQQDFDNKYGITNIAFLKSALAIGPDQYSGIEIALKEKSKPSEVKKQVQAIFGKTALVLNKYEQNKSLYSIMTVERWVIYAILSLILVVAAFNMIGALTMLVLEKQKDISILHALGSDRPLIQRIFMSEGLLLAFIGGLTGMGLALLIAWLQLRFHLIPLPGSFLIDYFPVKLKSSDFLLVGSTVLVVALIASWIPARKAAGQDFNLRSE